LEPDHCLRLTDRAPLRAPVSGEFLQGDLTDPAFAEEVTEGVGAIIHLAGDPRAEAQWDTLLDANIRATANLFESAQHHGVRKIIYASSVHAAGAYNDPEDWPVQASWPARPCCRYGASKVAGEVLARLYADQVHDSSVICLRLALVGEAPRWSGEAGAWLDMTDLARLVRRALEADVSFGVLFGVSASDRPRYDSGELEREIGYVPAITAPDAGSLTSSPPHYASGCQLWRLRTNDLDSPTTKNGSKEKQ